MNGSSARARLARVFSAQAYNQAATMGVQLLLVPLLLHAWGTERYGVWLLLSAIPTYLTLSDFGFTFIAKNEMVMQVAAGRREEARRTFHSVFAMLSVVGPALLVIVLSTVWLVDLSKLLSLGSYPTENARIVLALLLFNVIGYQFALLVGAGIRCENRAALESSWAASARIGEGLLMAVAALAGGGLLSVALAATINRAAFIFGSYRSMRRHTPWLALGYSAVDRTEIKRLFRPALGYMLMPISQALLIQGPVLVLGALSGPVEVVVLSTSRTLARLGTAATNMLNNTLIAEYSARAGRGDRTGFARLFNWHIGASAVAIAPYGGAILLISRPLMRVFTHGKVPIVEPFFAILVGSVAAEMLWTAMFTPVSAINRHVRVTNWLFCASGVGLVLCWLLASRLGLTGAALALLAVHGTMIIICATIGKAGRIGDGDSAVAPTLMIAEPVLDVGPAGEGELHVA
jgi:O-antigen/teichoic acid export membrane protein